MRPLAQRLFEPVDAASVAVFRMVFGLAVLIGVVRYVAYGWVDLLYVQPATHFTWPGFGWVVPLPGGGMYAVYGLLGLCAVGVTLGAWYRASIAGVLVLFTYIELIDKTNYLNHYYLVSLLALMLLFMPAHRVWSVDRPGGDTVPAWVVWALRLQLGLVYLFAGTAKLSHAWLFEAMPLKIWLPTHAGLPLVGPLLEQAWVAHAMSVGGAAFDLSVPFLLLFRRTRALGFALVLVFHVATGALFNIGMFPLIMIGLTPVFFEPDWPRRLLRTELRDPAPVAGSGRARLATMGALGLWFAVQLALPARAWLYPGDVRWTHEGWRFSWRVLLVESRGFFKYRLVDPSTGQRWAAYPEAVLDPRQRHLASSSPDMILEYAHDLAAEYRAAGHPDIEVYCDAWLSVNGAPAARLVDPAVDLASRPRTVLAPYDWLLPPPEQVAGVRR